MPMNETPAAEGEHATLEIEEQQDNQNMEPVSEDQQANAFEGQVSIGDQQVTPDRQDSSQDNENSTGIDGFEESVGEAIDEQATDTDV